MIILLQSANYKSNKILSITMIVTVFLSGSEAKQNKQPACRQAGRIENITATIISAKVYQSPQRNKHETGSRKISHTKRANKNSSLIRMVINMKYSQLILNDISNCSILLIKTEIPFFRLIRLSLFEINSLKMSF